jgi:hypothetical protein
VQPDGQVVAVPQQEVGAVEVEILEVSDPGFDPGLANAVGFAEVGLGDLRVEETVRLPRDLLDEVGEASHDRSLDLVLTRLRTDPDDWTRGDDEMVLDRSFDLPTARSFTLTGTAVRPAVPPTRPRRPPRHPGSGGDLVLQSPPGFAELSGVPGLRRRCGHGVDRCGR